jgi:tight adherence protein C
LFDTLLALGASAGVGVLVTCVILALSAVAMMLPDDDREYMDPPPAFIKPLWPLVRIISYFIGSNLPANYLDQTDAKLQNNGASFMLTAEEYFSACVVLAMVLPALGFMALGSSGDVNPLLLLILAVVGFFVPEFWIKDTRAKRDKQIIKTLPVFLEYLTMCVDAGLNFSGALKQAVEKGPAGPMKNEFKIILRDISSGQTRADALLRMEKRVLLKDVSVFVNAVIQAEKMGSSLKETLMIQAEQRLDERFQQAEKAAMEAPVKLIVPLVVFIFPLTFVILLFPMVVKFMTEGTM